MPVRKILTQKLIFVNLAKRKSVLSSNITGLYLENAAPWWRPSSHVRRCRMTPPAGPSCGPYRDGAVLPRRAAPPPPPPPPPLPRSPPERGRRPSPAVAETAASSGRSCSREGGETERLTWKHWLLKIQAVICVYGSITVVHWRWWCTAVETATKQHDACGSIIVYVSVYVSYEQPSSTNRCVYVCVYTCLHLHGHTHRFKQVVCTVHITSHRQWHGHDESVREVTHKCVCVWRLRTVWGGLDRTGC